MFQIITETYIDGERQIDMVYSKIYKRLGAATRNVKGSSYVTNTDDGRRIERIAYVRGFLNPVDADEAKEAYVRCRRIWIDSKYGKIRLMNSWEYGSHAPASELFWRSVEQVGGYGYDSNFYVEDEN